MYKYLKLAENKKEAKIITPIKVEAAENQLDPAAQQHAPMNRFRVIEHEDSQNGNQGFDIVFNNSGSVMRYDGGLAFAHRISPVVIIQS
jgi:hypothetical protein